MQETNTFNPFVGPAIEKIIPLVQAQTEVWIACKLGGEDANRAYNESVSLIFDGLVDYVVMERALDKVSQRHEALRSTISADGRFMIVYDNQIIPLQQHDLSGLPEKEKDQKISEYLSEDAYHIFNLVQGPLIKVGLIKISDQKYQLVITAHHIILDGWSAGILLEELGIFYSSIKSGNKPDIPQAETFSSYAEHEKLFMQTNDYKNTELFWLQKYHHSVPQVNLPTDFPRPKLRTFKSHRLDFELDPEIVTEIKNVGVKSGASLVVTVMAAFEVLLYQVTSQQDLVLGLPASGQALSGKTQLIGHCVNILPLRTQLLSNEPFSKYLIKRKSEVLDAYEHQQLSFGQLLQKLPISRDSSRVPLVPIIFNIDMGMDSGVAFDGVSHQLKSNPRAFEAFELFLNITGSKDHFILEWSYNSSLFKPSTIESMMDSYKNLLLKIVEDPNIAIGELIQTNTSVYDELNSTKISYTKATLHELIFKKAQTLPDKPAVKYEGASITYGDLNEEVHRYAHYLKNHGVKPGDGVALSLPRSIEVIISVLAIMECGAFYVPLDPNYPKNRLEFMLADSKVKLVITSNRIVNTFKNNVSTLYTEDILSKLSNFPATPLNLNIGIDQIVYTLYTSGSTGKPKGVSVTHKNLVNLCFSMSTTPGMDTSDKLLSITNISFDMVSLDLYLPLFTGAELIFANEETAKDTRLLLELLQSEGITMMQATPTTWQLLIHAGWNQKLSLKALCGGEALNLVLAKNIISKVDSLWNMYGPTETTVWSCCKKISASDEIIAIGRPIANTQIYVVNETGQLASPGTSGELCIAGDGVAKGYWERPELTKEKFVSNPFENSNGPVLYKTGDLAKLLPSGELQCLGRIDNQVKIRGQRIELGEIEELLDGQPGVHSSVVLYDGNHLIAYVVPSGQEYRNENSADVWKSSLKEQLPAHMIPYKFNFVESFPLSPNGKVDRKALISLLPSKSSNKTYAASKTESEKIIAKIWEEYLEMDKIDVNGDFFELGGHSLIAVRVMTQLEKETNKRLPLAALLEHPTVSELAAYMDSEFIKWDSLVPLQPKGNKPPIYIVHGAHHNVMIFNDLAQKLDKDQPVYGLQARGLDGKSEPHESIHEMAKDYISEIVASNPKGPYNLAGFSLGGVIAFEMARQLRAQGRDVKMVAEFDSYVFPYYYYNNSLKKKIVSILYLLGKILFIFLNMFSSKKNFKRRTGLIKLFISGLFLRLKLGKEKQYEMQFNRSLKLETNHNRAADNYTIDPQDIAIDLFRATEEINFVHDPNLLGWKKIARKGVRKHMVPGNHIDMFYKGNVEVFAKKLQDALDNHNVDSFD